MNVAHPDVVARARALVASEADADALLATWLRRFMAVADRAPRRALLARLIDEADDASLLGLLHRIDARALSGDNTCRALSAELALSPSVLSELPYDRTVELYAAARAADLPRLAARFLGTRGGDAAREGANPHLEISAGERTAAARGRDRLVLDRVLHDRDPRVIAALLDNPRLTERDVVRVAAMRPTTPAILQLIASHHRWGRLYRVRKAVAFNPATPISVSRPLLPTLLRQDLAALAGSQVLSEELRGEVKAILAHGDHPG